MTKGGGTDKCKRLRDKMRKAFKKYKNAEKTYRGLLYRTSEICGHHTEACGPEPIFDETECNRLLDICIGAHEAWKDSKDDYDAAHDKFEEAQDALSDCEHKKKSGNKK
jgi:hypothetical protein